MRVALLSDIHSNLTALNAVIAECDRSAVDKIVCLGDVIDMGPQPVECLELLRQRVDLVVGGNHDPLDEGPPDPLLAGIEKWTAQQLSDADRALIASWPFSETIEANGAKMLCVHGSPRANTDDVLVDLPHDGLITMLGDADFDVMVCGHTHVQLVRRLGKRVVVNVGSVGMPFEKPFAGKPPKVYRWAEYAIVELGGLNGGTRIDLRQTEYDIEAHFTACRASGMPSAETWIGNWVE